MNYVNIQIDFVERTIANLKFVKKKGIEQNEDFNEVTNLINCLLGLVCYPHEISSQRHIKLNKEAEVNIYKHTVFGDIYLCSTKTRKNCTSFPTIIRHVRNSICHGNFIPWKIDENNEIAELRFFDFTNKRRNCKTFDMVMTVAQMRAFAEQVARDYIQEAEKKS